MVKDDPQILPRRWAAVFQTTTVALCIAVSGATRLSVPARSASWPIVSSSRVAQAVVSKLPPAKLAEASSAELIHDYTPAIARPPLTGQVADEATSKVIWMEVTAYCACTHCCGPNAHGITASGKDVGYNQSAFVAADTDLFSFGSKLRIPGYHDQQPVEVIDRGSAIKGNHIDVFFTNHEDAVQWGRRWLPVVIDK